VKFLFYKIFRETKLQDGLTALSTEALLLQALARMQGDTQSAAKQTPLWVGTLKEILNNNVAAKSPWPRYLQY
jgi:AraC family transcriptional regulator